MMEIFCILIVITVSQVYTFVKIHWTVYLKWVDFTISQSYLNKLLIFFLKGKIPFYHLYWQRTYFFLQTQNPRTGITPVWWGGIRPDHGPIIAPTYKEGADLQLHNPVANSLSFSKMSP